MAQTVHVKTETDEFTLKGRLCELSGHSFIPPERHNPKEVAYFNSDKKVLLVYIGYNKVCDDLRQFNWRLLVTS